ncbi:hypothetical protein ACGFSB_34610 [Streptomyces sp. NPDC048441]|uniref:hypothetical protein n=1 Tax=Streptomyces sp. NPDC048441 TaxID=3365552 RepID=UPI00371381E7
MHSISPPLHHHLLMVCLTCPDGHQQWGLWRESAAGGYETAAGMYCGGTPAGALADAGVPGAERDTFVLGEPVTPPALDLHGLPACRWSPPVGRGQVMAGTR